jgi:hypothetical protein
LRDLDSLSNTHRIPQQAQLPMLAPSTRHCRMGFALRILSPGAEAELKLGVAAAGARAWLVETVTFPFEPHPVYQCSRNRSTVESSVSMHAHNLGPSTGG